jgi:ribosomal protein S18 acetylase RimI-like enzyme
MEHAVAACRSDGATVVTLSTAVADVDNVHFYQRRGFRASAIEREVFTPENSYPAGLESDGISVRDGIRFAIELRPVG